MLYFNNLSNIQGEYDIVVGIPSFNNEDTIAHVCRTASEGIRALGLRGLVANSDGGSSDNTVHNFLSAKTEGVDNISIKYKGLPGKGSAIRALFEIAHKVNAKVFVMLDSDLRSVEPWWVERLARPILDGKTDYVTPLYLRHKYDGTITNNICYPLTCALYGVKIRQPIGGDFGVGRKLIDVYLGKPESVWQTNVAKFGIDIWMTTIALNESDKKPMQAALGAKVHDVKDPGKHLQGMFIQVVETLFSLMMEYEEKWKNVSEIVDTEVYGEQPSQNVEEIIVDLEGLKQRAINEILSNNERLYFIPPEIVEKVKTEGKIKLEEWVQIVYQATIEYKKTMSSNVVLAILPFYFARVADFIESTLNMTTEEAEKIIEAQLLAFIENKRLLFERW
ncbi:MAG: glycosyltransferase [Fervidobacterium sp.]|uniref:glycosyltransferase n=1 Tax=Fervidobacterium sp. TaxID=1871331 RepID=UPI00404A230C